MPQKYIHRFLGVWRAPQGDSYVPISLDISRPAVLSIEEVATDVLWRETDIPLPQDIPELSSTLWPRPRPEVPTAIHIACNQVPLINSRQLGFALPVFLLPAGPTFLVPGSTHGGI